MHVFKNQVVEWVVAYDLNDAVRVMREYLSQQFPLRCDEVEGQDWSWACFNFVQESDRKILTVVDERLATKSGRPRRLRRSCARWARENGRGFLCSTEW